MGEQKRKQEHALISVLVPERGRPEELERLVASLGQHERVEVLVQVDDDDPAWMSRSSSVAVLRRPRPPTLGEKLNQLAAEAQGDILLFLANDLAMTTLDWPAKVREAVAKLPNGIGIAYMRDPTHPGHTSYWAMTRRMYDTVGFFSAPYFPYWFVDTWWDEVGILTGIKVEIDAEVASPDGRGGTLSGRPDLGFWCRFFEDTRPMRFRDAFLLLKAAHGDDYLPAAEETQQRLRACAERTAHMHTAAFQQRWGSDAVDMPPGYAETKALAEQLLEEIRKQQPRKPRVALCVPSGRSWEAAMGCSITALAAYSAMAGIDIAVVNVQSSMITHGRNQTVEIALAQQCDWLLWFDSDQKVPPDALVRLLRHDKEIVGATYNKRVPPYETLGKLAGPRPENLDGGLHEALLLPGGMLLVKADVYRRLGYPWYAEAYQWPGADGFERFWNMASEIFWQKPPAELSASIAGTAFATWMRDNYRLGEFGEDFTLLSEDLFFMRKARRAGYRVWCDLSLTYETIHIGVTEITCARPSPGQTKQLPPVGQYNMPSQEAAE